MEVFFSNISCASVHATHDVPRAQRFFRLCPDFESLLITPDFQLTAPPQIAIWAIPAVVLIHATIKSIVAHIQIRSQGENKVLTVLTLFGLLHAVPYVPAYMLTVANI